MDHLFTYIEAINTPSKALQVVNKVETDNSYNDQGMAVASLESILSFSNGVRLKHCVEFDQQPQAATACAECWISYEILGPHTATITPLRKTFVNQCQQDFWLKIQKLSQS
ncbi:MAG: hypothetical protein V7752_19710 [Halopseudomonas sp.]